MPAGNGELVLFAREERATAKVRGASEVCKVDNLLGHFETDGDFQAKGHIGKSKLRGEEED